MGGRWRNLIVKIGAWFGLLLLFGATRLPNLTLLPIFTDEAIYIRWSQIGSRDAAWRFISLVDGKQPMFTWIMMVFLRIFDDPLFAGRLVSVFAGALSVVGIWVLSKELFKSTRSAFLSSLLYILSPFALMYDRMALYDSLVATFFIWNLYLAILLVRTIRLDVALLFGMMLGAGMLNKTSGFLSLYLVPSTLILFDWAAPHKGRRLIKWIGLVVLSTILSQLAYSMLRLSPLFHMIAQKDAVFVYPINDWLSHPFKFFKGNMQGLLDWLTHYLTIPVFVACVLPITVFWNKHKEKTLLLIWCAAPLVALALFGKVLYPRFVLFMAMPLLVIAGLSVDWLVDKGRRRPWALAVGILLLLEAVHTDFFIVTNPQHARIPFADRGQLIENWPSGWGVREVNAFLKTKAQKEKVTVFTEGTFGLMPYAIEIYLVDDPNMTIKGIWPLPEEMPEEMAESAAQQSTYFVLNQSQEPPAWPIELVAQYQKGNRQDRHLRFYRVIAPPSKV